MNISLSEHRSNNDNSLTPEGIIEILKEYKKAAIAYAHRQMSPIVYRRLVETGILTIDVTKPICWKRKANDKKLIRKLDYFVLQYF